MSAYEALAPWYDALTGDVPYEDFADYYEAVFARRGGEVHTLLDLCCGTGTLSCLLAERGYELICVDGSPDMLTVFREKCEELPAEAIQPLLLCQEAAGLDLYGTVDGAYCSLDGLNYLPAEELPELFRRLRLFIVPGGTLIFDVNAPERLRSLDSSCSVDEGEDLLCLWRASFDPEGACLRYGVDIFQRGPEGLWRRDQEEHVEYAHEPEMLVRELEKAGFGRIELDREGPQGELGRIFLIAERKA